MSGAEGVADWLLDGDPSVRWQAERDLLDRPEVVWSTTRDRVAAEGWGRRLLGAQDPEGTWAGALYSPKWTSTTYTLLLLQRFGLPPGHEAALAGCARLLDDAVWVDGGVSYWRTHTHAERCVNGMVLSVCSWFGLDDPRVDSIADLLLGAAMGDGAWNCRDHEGATHSSFHTTISVLEGLVAWSRFRVTTDADESMAGAHEFLLQHHLFRSHRTGEVIDDEWLKPHFPPRWHYDVLRGLDHLRDAGMRDPRAAEAVEIVRSQQRPDGRWPKGPRYPAKEWFVLEPGRVPSRWNTLRALRALRWWDAR
ncbi:MAG: hypothetical protein AB1Z57_05985 [Acidimicrobiia bacterium]